MLPFGVACFYFCPKTEQMDKKTERIYREMGVIWEATEGLQAVREDEKKETIENKKKTITNLGSYWGFINEDGQIVVDIKYHSVWKFRNGLAKVRLDNKWGMVNVSGFEVIPIIYQTLHHGHDEMIQVQFANKWGYIDKTGGTVIEIKYDYVLFPFRTPFAWIKTAGKYGFINLQGKEIVTPQFDSVGQISPDGYVKTLKDGAYEMLNLRELDDMYKNIQ